MVQEEVAEPVRGAKNSWLGVCVGCAGTRWLQHVSTRIYLNTFSLTKYIRTKNKKTNEIFVVHIFVYQRVVQVVQIPLVSGMVYEPNPLKLDSCFLVGA